MPRTLAYALCAATTIALASHAQAEEDCLVPYKAFQKYTPSIALQTCPDWTDADNGFCRLTLEDGRATMYIFEKDNGEACLKRARSWSVEAFFKRFAEGF